MPFPFHFESLSLKKADAYLERLSRTPQKASDYSLVNLWGWQGAYGLKWAWEDPLVWISQSRPREILWAPVGPWEEVDWSRCLPLLEAAHAVFTRVPEKLTALWRSAFPGQPAIEPERGHWDYLYRMQDLAFLKGNRFHKKKNQVNRFIKKHAFDYVSLDATRIGEVLLMQENWCTWKDCGSSETLEAENRAIALVLEAFSGFQDLLGGALRCDGRMIAYTIGERLDAETLLIHFEKGDPDYPGVYQAINQLFLSHHADQFQIVNREQDLDDPGLRKAKLSYHPVDFVRKFRVSLGALPGESTLPAPP